jgi:hypothetical protein
MDVKMLLTFSRKLRRILNWPFLKTLISLSTNSRMGKRLKLMLKRILLSTLKEIIEEIL